MNFVHMCTKSDEATEGGTLGNENESADLSGKSLEHQDHSCGQDGSPNQPPSPSYSGRELTRALALGAPMGRSLTLAVLIANLRRYVARAA